jgi:hypothetical protein
MSKILFIDCIALLKVWATGFLGFHINGLIHILPVVAIFALLLGILRHKLSTH